MKFGLLALIVLSVSCGGSISRSVPTPTAEAPPPAAVGPVLLYTYETRVAEREGQYQTFLVAYDVGGARELRQTVVPGGTALTLTSHQTILTRNPGDGVAIDELDPLSGKQRSIYRSDASGEWSVAVSPDGEHVAITEVRDASNYDDPSLIRLLDLDSGQVSTLATFGNPLGDEFGGRPTPRVWRDDGRGILVSGDTRSGAPGSWATVWLDGTVTVHLRGFADPSPNGRALALDSVNSVGCILAEKQELTLFNLDSGERFVVAEDPGKGLIVDGWSPDGTELLFEQYTGVTHPGDCVPTLDPATARAFVANAVDGGVRDATSAGDVRRAWRGGVDVAFACEDPVAPDVYGSCPGGRESLSVNGIHVKSGQSLRYLGLFPVSNSVTRRTKQQGPRTRPLAGAIRLSNAD
jgi:hypothetical protein